uniref:Cilia- and flagella-associated protein 410 n=1 Tax=Lepisosteus oculatus TaxID=7918 RepID=W5MUD9_LEPOC|nr:PREDICTED: protein C21orf2 isoform X1 [Lepisosteus oculatus]
MKLTPKLVLAKAKASDLDSVKKLNCWGCNLTDISIFAEIPNIEVLTLSANKIDTLKNFSQCRRLSELYLRKNLIENLAELHYLTSLPCLRVLWLSENPCCGEDPQKYRLTVLRILPGLHKLDNQVVTEEELAKALEEGEEISAPPASHSNTNGVAEAHQELIPADHVADTESDPLNYSMEETNKIREQLGMKPLSRDKFPSLSSPRETGSSLGKKSHALDAVLLLLKDLNSEELQIVQKTTESRLRVLQRQDTSSEKTSFIQH